MKYTKPIFTLILITPFLTELLTYNMPINVFFSPIPFLCLIIIYWLAVLILREFSIILNTWVIGIFISGIAYGIYNEWVIAKTLFMTNTVPIAESYGNYHLILWINFAFSIFILSWHALHSVLFPIVIVDSLYPNFKNKRFLSNKKLIIISAIVLWLGIFSFFTNWTSQPWIYLIIFILIITSLIGISKYTNKPKLNLEKKRNWIFPVLLWILFIIIYSLLLHNLGKNWVQIYVLFLSAIIILFGFYKILKTKWWLSSENLALFGIGSYSFHSIFNIIKGTIEVKYDLLITEIILLIFLLFLIFRIRKQKTLN